MQSKVLRTETVQAAIHGSSEAFEEIYRSHKRRVYSLCLRMVRDATEAEDLTQEVFMQLFRKISTFRGESAFSTWLYRLAINIVLMSIRAKRMMLVPLEDETDSHDGQMDEIRKELGAADRVLGTSIERVSLERALEVLPPGYRIVFLLHDVEGYEHQEIAELLGCSVGNCKSQLHKARLKMRKFLSRPKESPLAARYRTSAMPVLKAGHRIVKIPPSPLSAWRHVRSVPNAA